MRPTGCAREPDGSERAIPAGVELCSSCRGLPFYVCAHAGRENINRKAAAFAVSFQPVGRLHSSTGAVVSSGLDHPQRGGLTNAPYPEEEDEEHPQTSRC